MFCTKKYNIAIHIFVINYAIQMLILLNLYGTICPISIDNILKINCCSEYSE